MDRSEKQLPSVRVVRGAARDRTWKDQVSSALDPAREGAERTLTVFFGLLPVFAVVGLIIALAWGFAMFQSP